MKLAMRKPYLFERMSSECLRGTRHPLLPAQFESFDERNLDIAIGV